MVEGAYKEISKRRIYKNMHEKFLYEFPSEFQKKISNKLPAQFLKKTSKDFSKKKMP